MNFKDINNIQIPEGSVSRITDSNGFILWEQGKVFNFLLYETVDKWNVIVPNVDYLYNNDIISNENNSTQQGKITFQKNLIAIWEEAFARLTNLEYMYIPDGVTIIQRSAFNQSYLAEVRLPNTLEEIETFAFRYTKLSKVIMPDSVTNLGYSVFLECNLLETIQLSNNLKSIPERTFYYCQKLKEITIPNSVTSIEQYAFYGCKGLKEITIPNSVTSIEQYAFYGCSNIETITLSKLLQTIGEHAFNNCNIQRYLTIPENVVSIGDYAFANNNNLYQITSLAMKAPTIQENTFFCIAVEVAAKYCILRVPQGATGYEKWLSYLGQKWTIEYITE